MTSHGVDSFPATAQKFYQRRDHRTNHYREVDLRYANKVVKVTADRNALVTLSGQVMLLVTCNLLARWCRHVAVTVDDTPLHVRFGENQSLVRQAIDVMSDADPFGQFTTDSDTTADLHVHIGNDCPPTEVRTTVLTSAGWIAGVKRPAAGGLRMSSSENPIGAACAAVLGGAQLFRDALERSELFRNDFAFDVMLGSGVSADTTNDVDLPSDHIVGKVLIAGAGSVSSAALYFAHLFRVHGLFDLADADFVKVENFGRSPLFGRRNFGSRKVFAIAKALRGSTVQLDPRDSWWHEAGLSPTLAGYDVLLPLANEFGIRWDLQNRVPPLMIHASTGRNWNVNFGRHIPGRDDCLADRFEGLHDRPTFGCSEGQVEVTPELAIDAALPFLSFFSGLLVAADLVRLGMPNYPHTPNFGNYSFRGGRFTPQLHDLGPRAGCVCTSQSELFWRMRSATRYAGLSPHVRH